MAYISLRVSEKTGQNNPVDGEAVAVRRAEGELCLWYWIGARRILQSWLLWISGSGQAAGRGDGQVATFP